MDFKEREKKLLNALDWLIFLVASVTLAALIIFHFLIPNVQVLTLELRTFLQTLIANLIPVPLLFIISYAVYRRIQTIRDEHDKNLFIENLADNLADKLAAREVREVLSEIPHADRDKALKSAKELWLIGVVLNKTVSANFALLQSKLRQGSRIRVLLVNPEGISVSLIAKRKTHNVDAKEMRNYINLTLLTLYRLKQEFTDNLDIRVIDYPLTFGAVSADIKSSKGMIYVEYYSFKNAKEGPHLMLSVKDKPWYDYFSEQMVELWNTSEEWVYDGFKVIDEPGKPLMKLTT
ncbi:MAG: hypothetical protein ACOYNY_08780 [Caldilineaceae bacterium]